MSLFFICKMTLEIHEINYSEYIYIQLRTIFISLYLESHDRYFSVYLVPLHSYIICKLSMKYITGHKTK